MQVQKVERTWEKMSSLGIEKGMSDTEVIRVRMLNQVATVGLIACIVTIIIYFYLGNNQELIQIGYLCILFALLVLFLNYKGRNDLGWHLGLIAIPTVLTAAAILVQPVPGLALISLSFIIILRYIFRNNFIRGIYYVYYGITSLLIILSPAFGGRIIEHPLILNFIQSLIGVTLHIIFSNFLSKELSSSEKTLKENEKRITKLLDELKLRNLDLEEKVRQRTSSLLKANAELQESNEELKRFSYATSHDLQEPLRMIGSFVQLLDKKYGDQLGQDGKEYIDYALEGSRRISNLLRSILKYKELGKEEVKLELVYLKTLIENGIKGLNALISEKNAQVEIGEIPEQVKCEPEEMSLVFYNLIQNGLTFNKSTKPKVVIKGEEKSTHWLISVEDNGVGIAPQYVDRVFRVFQRLNNRKEYSGAGMGLPLCQRIMDRHNGKIWLTSKEGDGTTFFFTINKNMEA